jgi:hypothetical protein
MIKFIWKPTDMVKNMLKYNYLLSLLYLLITGLLLFFTAKLAGLDWLQSFYVFLGVLVTLILGALALNIILWVWNKANYLLALNTLLVPWFIMAVGALLMALLGLIPVAGPVLSGLVTLLIIPLAVSIQLKLLTDNFKLDLLTAVVMLLILYIGAGAAITGIVSLLALQLVSTLGFGLLPIAFP